MIKTIEHIDHYQPTLVSYELLTSTDNDCEIGFVREQNERDRQLENGHNDAQKSYMYMMTKMKDLFGLINLLKKIIYGIGLKLILNRNNNDRPLFRFDAGAGAVPNDCRKENRDITWNVPCIDPSNDDEIIVQNGLIEKNNIDISLFERKPLYKIVPD